MIDTIDERDIGCFILAALLVIGGTVAGALLPDSTSGLVVSGGLIVAGFAVVFVCFR